MTVVSSRPFPRAWPLAAVLFGLLMAAPSLAVAQPLATAIVTTALNMRSGPATSYGVVLVIPANAVVTVRQCNSAETWCQLDYRGRIGWASARYLSFEAASGDPEPPPAASGADGGPVFAQVTINLNMRRGPSTSYAIIHAIPAGSTVPVHRCIEGYAWCEVTHAGSTGWVSATYLRSTAPQYGQQPFAAIAAQLFQFLLGQIGGGQVPTPPPPPPQQRVPGPNEVCFYRDFDYGGPVTCALMGQAAQSLGGGWNDAISSIRIGRGAWVEACQDVNYGGACRTYADDIAQLPGVLNDRISSFRTVPAGGGGNPGPTARACFYADWDYQGQSFCLSLNDTLALLSPDWNDRISSIRIDPGLTVQVCQHGEFGGWCEQYTGDVPRLVDTRNDAISSIRIR